MAGLGWAYACMHRAAAADCIYELRSSQHQLQDWMHIEWVAGSHVLKLLTSNCGWDCASTRALLTG